MLDAQGQLRPPHPRARSTCPSMTCVARSPTTSASAPKLGYDVVQIYTTPRIVRMLEVANAEAERLKDEFVGVEHLLIAIADEREGESARHPARVQRRQGAHLPRPAGDPRHLARRQPARREPLPGAGEVLRRPHGGGAPGQAGPGHRPRGRDSARHADPQPAHARTTR